MEGGKPTFVGTSHPLEIVCKCSLSPNEVGEDADLGGRGAQASGIRTFHRAAQTTRGAPAHVLYLFNAPGFPSVGTSLRHLKHSQLEIYSKLEALIFSTIWHWPWLFFGVQLTTEESNLK